jgi:hypothetical protein
MVLVWDFILVSPNTIRVKSLFFVKAYPQDIVVNLTYFTIFKWRKDL